MTLLEKLSEIQMNLRVPKKRENSFGNFKYRNLDDETEALKKYEKEYRVVLTFETEPLCIGQAVYIKATAILYDLESQEKNRGQCICEGTTTA